MGFWGFGFFGVLGFWGFEGRWVMVYGSRLAHPLASCVRVEGLGFSTRCSLMNHPVSNVRRRFFCVLSFSMEGLRLFKN